MAARAANRCERRKGRKKERARCDLFCHLLPLGQHTQGRESPDIRLFCFKRTSCLTGRRRRWRRRQRHRAASSNSHRFFSNARSSLVNRRIKSRYFSSPEFSWNEVGLSDAKVSLSSLSLSFSFSLFPPLSLSLPLFSFLSLFCIQCLSKTCTVWAIQKRNVTLDVALWIHNATRGLTDFEAAAIYLIVAFDKAIFHTKIYLSGDIFVSLVRYILSRAHESAWHGPYLSTTETHDEGKEKNRAENCTKRKKDTRRASSLPNF